MTLQLEQGLPQGHSADPKLLNQDRLAEGDLRHGVVKELRGQARVKPSARQGGDKTPEAAMAIPALTRLYPDARFVHVIRDGRDGAVSGWAHLERLGQTDQFATFADYAEYFAENHWRGYIQAVRDAGRALPGRVIEVRYEALHARPESELRRVLALLGIDQADTISRCVEAASFEILSGGRTRGQELTDSHFRKGIVGDWRNSFDDEAEHRFEAAAGDLLRELGYSRTSALRPAPASRSDYA